MDYINGYSSILLIVLIFLFVIRGSRGGRKEDVTPEDNSGETVHRRERSEDSSSPQREESD